MIESVQYNAALAITGCIRGTSRSDKMYKELGIMSLYDRRNFRRLVFFYKIKNDLLPNYLKLLIPDEVVSTNYKFRECHRNNIPTRTVCDQKNIIYRSNLQLQFVYAWGTLSKFITGSCILLVNF